MDNAQDARALPGRAGWVASRCGALETTFQITSPAGHAQLPWSRAEGPLLWSGEESDPHVFKPTCCIDSENVCLQGLDWPSVLSKMASVSGQAKTGPKMLGFGGLFISRTWNGQRSGSQGEAALPVDGGRGGNV
jgi:hypothetical protein